MSDWFDNRKKRSSHFRKLLKDSKEQSQPAAKTLDDEQQKRLSKLKDIFDKLKRGENVQNRQLQTWLTSDEYAQIEAEWREQLEIRNELKIKPTELRRYEDKLKKATFFFNRAEGYSRRGNNLTAEAFYRQSRRLCEEALETLHEILLCDVSIRFWLDRDVSFKVVEGQSADIASLPRLITSRSIESIGSDCRIVRKQGIKLGVVERAAERIGRDS